MSEITTQLLNDVKVALENGEMLQIYLRNNNINVRVPQLRQAFIDEFGQDSFRNSTKVGMPNRIRNRISMMSDRGMFDTVEKCDAMIVALNQAIEILNTKKIELMG